jgi:predicted ribosomally synthesized peptide with nif11-like leader
LGEALDAFVRSVHGDPALGDQLDVIAADQLLDEVLRIAQARGYDVTRAEIDDALRLARHAWLMRWTA